MEVLLYLFFCGREEIILVGFRRQTESFRCGVPVGKDEVCAVDMAITYVVAFNILFRAGLNIEDIEVEKLCFGICSAVRHPGTFGGTA